MSGSVVNGGWDTVSRFCSLGCAVMSKTEISNEELDDGREGEPVATSDGDSQLVYVRRFLHDAADETIPERFFEGNFDHLVCYRLGPLDQ